ncbi:hypothetical protein NC653_031074 [Populus alba x Populus x berolinensis]|uniref:Uncharacterized protein n=1 Tax=Populus alba x Populus x berolinensis TaxID=444605 RepID=A0AAD6LXI6_9ROSI|nr:hypothetical protein NC653_031074 [Populus alba x Populus x berolinensis]
MSASSQIHQSMIGNTSKNSHRSCGIVSWHLEDEFEGLEAMITTHCLMKRFTLKLCHPYISFPVDPLQVFRDGLEIAI